MKTIVLYVLLFVSALLSWKIANRAVETKDCSVLFENVEALAAEEIGGGVNCLDEGTIVCPIGGRRVMTVYYYGLRKPHFLY